MEGNGGDAGLEAPENLRDTIQKAVSDSQKEAHNDLEATDKPADDAAPTEPPSSPEAAPDSAPSQDSDFMAPASWSADAKEDFYKLPLNLQEQVAKRELELRRHLSTKGEELKRQQERYADLDAVIERNAARWDAQGVTPDQIFKNAIAWEEAFRANPLESWIETGRNFGIDVDAYLGKQSPQTQQQTNQVPTEFLSRFESLEQELESFKASSQQSVESQFVSQVDRWSTEKAEDGARKRPFAEAVISEMEAILPTIMQRFPQGDLTSWLDKSYEVACTMSDDVKIKMKAQAAKQTITDAQRRVSEAKRAATGLSHSASGPVISELPKDRREMIRQIYRQASGKS